MIKRFLKLLNEALKTQAETGLYIFHGLGGAYVYYDPEMMNLYIKKMKEKTDEDT
jgi:hypothetical protein